MSGGRPVARQFPAGINPGTSGDAVTSGSRPRLRRSNLDRSSVHKRSNDPSGIQTCHLYRSYAAGKLLAIPLSSWRSTSFFFLGSHLASPSAPFRALERATALPCRRYALACKSFRGSGATVPP
ncbi:hypothetical protein KM043_000358 [Ampulex compressa]|nr:hypothetical protein KM043_000358 [Ampulex compressa]